MNCAEWKQTLRINTLAASISECNVGPVVQPRACVCVHVCACVYAGRRMASVCASLCQMCVVCDCVCVYMCVCVCVCVNDLC